MITFKLKIVARIKRCKIALFYHFWDGVRFDLFRCNLGSQEAFKIGLNKILNLTSLYALTF